MNLKVMLQEYVPKKTMQLVFISKNVAAFVTLIGNYLHTPPKEIFTPQSFKKRGLLVSERKDILKRSVVHHIKRSSKNKVK